MKSASLFCLLLYLQLLATVAQAGTTGAIWGTIRDQLTQKEIIGATVQVEHTNHRCISDKGGAFNINQVPPGVYNLRVTMIGYVPVVVSKAVVKTDKRTQLTISLTPDIADAKEDIVIPGKSVPTFPVLNHYYNDIRVREILPLRKLTDLLKLQVNTTNLHLRGGRRNEIAFLVDGLPINDLYTGQTQLNLPTCAISDFTFYSNGFDAEFGQIMSGVANITTHEGQNNNDACFNLSFDNMAGVAKNDNANKFEWNWHGPMVIGFGGPLINLNCLFTGKVELSDTPWHNEMTRVLQSPIRRNYSFVAKVAYHILPNLRISFQGIYDRKMWHEYYYLWKDNLKNLPEFGYDRQQSTLTLQHELTSNFFYTFQASHVKIENSIEGLKSDKYTPPMRVEDRLTSPIIGGQMQWWEKRHQYGNLLKLQATNLFSPAAALKFGAEFQYVNLSVNNLHFQQIPVWGDPADIDYAVEKNDFHHVPLLFAAYLQSNFLFSDFGINLGLRMDGFDANHEAESREIVLYSAHKIQLKEQETPIRFRVSPRMQMTLALSSRDYLIFNYGWFYQMPPFYCFYTNLEHSFDGRFPLIGNPDLEHEKTILYELNYQHRLSEQHQFLITVFQKDISHLVGTKVYHLEPIITDEVPKLNPLAWAQYENLDRGTVNSLELSIQSRFRPWFKIQLGYAYTDTKGTAASPEERYYRMIYGLEQPEEEYPMDWDQRQAIIGVLDLGTEQKWGILAWAKIGSPLPHSLFDPNQVNDSRYDDWYTYFALKAHFSIDSFGGRISPFIEVTNLLNTSNYIGYDTNHLPTNFNPDDPTYYEPGRRIVLGINYHIR